MKADREATYADIEKKLNAAGFNLHLIALVRKSNLETSNTD